MYAASQSSTALGRALGETSQSPEGRQFEIPEQIALLRQQAAGLEAALNALLNRIAPVRRVAPPAAEANSVATKAERVLQSPMAQLLESVRVDLRHYTQRVDEALHDLELP